MYGRRLVENIDLDHYYFLSGVMPGAQFRARNQQKDLRNKQELTEADPPPRGMRSTSRMRVLREDDIPRFMNGSRAKRENVINSEAVDQVHGELLIE